MPVHNPCKKINMDHPERPRAIAQPRILVAPLDWGLGHATRCIPVIKELIARGCDVWIGSEGAQAALLQKEFPELPFLALPGYRIGYGSSARGLFWKVIIQIPKMLRVIRSENEWLKQMVAKYDFAAVISDNRYGLHYEKIPCIFITHQLSIKTSLGKWMEKMLQKWNYRFINRFTQCWVPDEEGTNNLAGELSHSEKWPAIPLKYVGVLSRFDSFASTDVEGGKNKHTLILLSGPEPQRTIWENKIIHDLQLYEGPVILVRGLPDSKNILSAFNNVQIFNHLTAVELNKAVQKSEWVISRCGYSTVMDIVKLQKKSILIPTPGQTEQEYLSFYLMKNHIAFCVNQNEFSLQQSLNRALHFSYQTMSFSGDKLKKTISEFISSLPG